MIDIQYNDLPKTFDEAVKFLEKNSEPVTHEFLLQLFSIPIGSKMSALGYTQTTNCFLTYNHVIYTKKKIKNKQ